MSSEEDEQQSVHSSDEDVDEEENPEEEVEAGEDGAGQVQALTERLAGLAQIVDEPNNPPQQGGPGAATVAEQIQHLPAIVADIQSGEPARQLDGTTRIRKLLSIERHPPITEVVATGVVPTLVDLLLASNPQQQFEACWALTNIASGTSEHTRLVTESGAVPIFVSLLRSPSDDVKEQAIWALGNIAGDSPQFRDFVTAQGMLAPLLEILSTEIIKLSALRNATWSLSNLCRGKPSPAFESVRDALPVLARLIYSADEEVLTDACWALSYLSDGPNDRIQAVVECGVCRRLVELLMHPSAAVQTPALRTLGNIVTGDDAQTQVVINCAVIPCLVSMLAHPKKAIRKETCWTLSNILSGNRDQIQAAIDGGAIPPLIRLLNTGEFEIRKEAAWCIANTCAGGSNEQIGYLAEQGAIPALADILTVQDSKIVVVGLEGLEAILRVGHGPDGPLPNRYVPILEECGAVEKLEELQNHENQQIYHKAVTLLTTYFGAEEGEDARSGGEQGGDESDEDGQQAQAAIQQPVFGAFAFGGNNY